MSIIWSFPTRIVFGAGCAREAGAEAVRVGARRPLLVTDAGVVSAGLAEPLVASLKQAGLEVAVFAGTHGNPTERDIEEGTSAYREHDADAVIAVGGGSSLDAGKLIVVRASVSLPFAELDDARGGGRHIPERLPPVLAVPTTAGTGSEVGRAAVVTVQSTGRKTVIFSPAMMPRVALLDPELTRTLPAAVTAATGFDALVHCLEAYLAVGDHPMADAIALGGLELVAQHLCTAVQDGGDLDARAGMMKAAMMGAVAFQKGLGACHSLAHPLSSEHGLHHGLANALCLPAVLDYLEPVVGARLGRVAALFDAAGQRGTCSDVLRGLRAQVGLPARLGEVGLQQSHLDRLAELAEQDACHRDSPRPCTRADLRALYAASL